MRFFRKIIIIIFLLYINVFGEEYRIGKVSVDFYSVDTVDFGKIVKFDNYKDVIASEKTLLELMNYLKNYIYDNYGYETFISIKDIYPTVNHSIVYINPKLKVIASEKITIDSILVRGVNDKLRDVFTKNLSQFIGRSVNTDLKIAVRRIINNYNFIRIVKEPAVVKSIDGKNCFYIELEEIRENKLLGSLAYIPKKMETGGYFTGNFEVSLHNFSGLGKKVEISWMRLNHYSQELKIHYFQPFLLRKNLFFDFRFSQILRDTLYVFRNFYLSSGISFKNTNLGIVLGSIEGIPTKSGGKILNEVRNRERSLGITFLINTRNNDINPTKGYFIKSNLLGNYRKYRCDKNFSYSIELDYDFNSSLGPLVFNLNGLLRKRWINLNAPLYTDYFWIGGSRDLRGYPEDFFKGLSVFVTSFEIRKILGFYSRIFVFTDIGYIDGIVPFSYGFGMTFNSGLGIIGLTLALGKDDTFSTAKIHLVFENRF